MLVRLGGGDTDLITEVPPARTRFVQLACMLLASSALASVSMFFALWDVTSSWLVSIPAALAWGVIILVVTRLSVVTAHASRRRTHLIVATLPRIIIALLFSTVIAVPIVVQIFSPDIQSQINATNIALQREASTVVGQIAADKAILAGHLPANTVSPAIQTARNRVNSLNSQVNAATKAEISATEAYECELYGDGPACAGASETPGIGPIAEEKKQVYEQAVSLANSLRQQLKAAQQDLAHANSQALTQAQSQAEAELPGLESQYTNLIETISYNQRGILAQLRALRDLSSHDIALEVTQYVLFTIFFLIEILPVAVALRFSLGPESAYDIAVRTREQELLERQVSRLEEASSIQPNYANGGPSTGRTATPSEYLVDENLRLTDRDPTALRREVAASLNNLGVLYSALGRPVSSLETSREAVDTYRDLANGNQEFVPDLAGALSNLGTRYAGVGRSTEALEMAEEAVSLYRSNGANDPEHQRAFAAALNNLGVRLAEAGRAAEALEATQEAITIYRQLAASQSDILPDLAGSLSNLGTRYAELGHSSSAVAAIREAILLHQSRPVDDRTFIPSLAAALNNLGVQYAYMGRASDALEVTQEAIARYRELVAENPAFITDLAGSLSNLGALYADLGRSADALPVTEEAVRLYRALASANPATESRLSASLNNLGVRYASLGRAAEALGAAREAVAIYRRLVEGNPTFIPDLAGCLSNLGALYVDLASPADAVPATQEAVALLSDLTRANPTYQPQLAAATANLAAALLRQW